jgi:hypothetical protein
MITPLMNLVRGTLAVLACLSMTGCYSLQRIDADPGPLQQMLRDLARTLLLGAGLVVAIVGLAAWSADWNSIELFEGSTASAMGGG